MIAAEDLKASLARRQLLDFAGRVYPGFQAPAHLRYLADLLERVERGEIRRLIVSLHPGSGKSTLLQMFVAWYLGRDPARKVIATSAAERLVVRNSRVIRDLFREAEWPFDAKIAPDATASVYWETSAGGGLYGVGKEGTITGWRAPLIVCDDLQDGIGSKIERDSTEDWFRGKLRTRLEPNGAIVLVQARWGSDDLPGRLMAGAGGKRWTYVRMPALAEENDSFGRAVGEPLWPERFDARALDEIREEIGPKHFAAQYQGSPTQDGGEVIRGEWFERYGEAPEFQRVVMALDAAAKTGIRNDYSAVVTIGVSKNAYYVLDVWRQRVEFPGLLRAVKALYEKHKPSRIYVEDTSAGVALIQQLKTDSHLPIVPVKALGSKESRVEAVSGVVEAGRVFLPRTAHWLSEFEDEVTAFPSGDHDDMVDAFAMALTQLRRGAGAAPWSFAVARNR